nr:hypothetical protein Itr_chr11CG19610 [Ipomoea trifida]
MLLPFTSNGGSRKQRRRRRVLLPKIADAPYVPRRSGSTSITTCCRRSRPAAASPLGVRRSLLENRGKDGDRSYILAGYSMLPPAICFIAAVDANRRRWIAVTHPLRCRFTEPHFTTLLENSRSDYADATPVHVKRRKVAAKELRYVEGLKARHSRKQRRRRRVLLPKIADAPYVPRRFGSTSITTCCRRSRPAAASPLGVRRSLLENRGKDGDRSYILAGYSMLPPAICFIAAVDANRRRWIAVTHPLRCRFTEPRCRR